MQGYKSIFIQNAYECGALRFGEFILNSGRLSQFFFNTGLFADGKSINAIANAYCESIMHNQIEFDMLFGPAYKGIPLITAIAQIIYQRKNQTVAFSFNRKEKKKHGEKGSLVGAKIKSNVLIIDDVISSGISIAQSINTIIENGGNIASILVALDRKERKESATNGENPSSIIGNIPVFSIINFFDILDFVKSDSKLKRYTESLVRYHEKYGIN